MVEYLRVFCHVGFFSSNVLSLNLVKEDCTMLVLSRRKGESIVIDGAIKVQVIELKGNVVRFWNRGSQRDSGSS